MPPPIDAPPRAGAAGRSVGVYLKVLLAGMLAFGMHGAHAQGDQSTDVDACGAASVQHGGQWQDQGTRKRKGGGGAQEEPTDDGRAIATTAPGPCDSRLSHAELEAAAQRLHCHTHISMTFPLSH
jgi:hypothetical protein